jgi:ABC-type dipeptide/oligopeptide/nickel transport system ATPase component
LFARLNRELHMGILYISHDLLSIASLCHRIAILHEGELVECGTTEQVFRSPVHPYARRLIGSLPSNPLYARPLATGIGQQPGPRPQHDPPLVM